jgi:dTDP-4-dehydrorhamnose 3,5-epimerase
MQKQPVKPCGIVIEEVPLSGCYVIHFPKNSDERGSFFRKYCKNCFLEKGLNTLWTQTNFSSNLIKGTLRGFHYQREPYQEIKLVSCVSGEVMDVLLDLRPTSKTYLKTFSINLSAELNTSIYIAKGVAHAYLSLQDNSAVIYQVSEDYTPEKSAGVNFFDRKIDVVWLIEPKLISNADRTWPPL